MGYFGQTQNCFISHKLKEAIKVSHVNVSSFIIFELLKKTNINSRNTKKNGKMMIKYVQPDFANMKSEIIHKPTHHKTHTPSTDFSAVTYYIDDALYLLASKSNMDDQE